MTTVAALTKLKQQQDLSYDESYQLALNLLSGQLDTNNIVELLHLLDQKGESMEEILGFVHAMRHHMSPVPINQDYLIDICGTGGSLPHRFNVSTCVALILGYFHYHVAKHGNRGSKKSNGSFDFLDELNINYSLSNEQHQSMMDRFNCTFLFARNYHPAVKHVAEARKLLRRRSIFNLIGPFCNPASPTIQIIGAPSKDLALRLMDVGQQLPYKVFGVISSDIGLDECSTVGKSTLYLLNNHHPMEVSIDPTEYNIHHSKEDIMGGESKENADLFMRILSNRMINHPITELLALNSAVIMHAIDQKEGIAENIQKIKNIIASGELLSYVQQYQMFQP